MTDPRQGTGDHLRVEIDKYHNFVTATNGDCADLPMPYEKKELLQMKKSLSRMEKKSKYGRSFP